MFYIIGVTDWSTINNENNTEFKSFRSFIKTTLLYLKNPQIFHFMKSQREWPPDVRGHFFLFLTLAGYDA